MNQYAWPTIVDFCKPGLRFVEFLAETFILNQVCFKDEFKDKSSVFFPRFGLMLRGHSFSCNHVVKAEDKSQRLFRAFILRAFKSSVINKNFSHEIAPLFNPYLVIVSFNNIKECFPLH